MAIETRGFTFVTSGKKRETLTGEATLRFFDHLSDFGKFDGIMPNIFTEISTVGQGGLVFRDHSMPGP